MRCIPGKAVSVRAGASILLKCALAALAAALFILPVAAPALDPTRSIGQFHHTSWTIANGMPANIWAIAQTPDDYLWLGSVNGLYRFDGVKVERVAADLLPSPSIHALAATADGGLWIGYERPVGTISYLKDGKVTNFRINSPNSTSVHAFAIGPDKTVWASTPDAILRFDGRQWQPVKGDFGTSFGEGRGGVWSFAVGADGVIWSKNLDAVFYLAPGQSRFVRAEGYAGGPEGFTAGRDGRLWTADSTRRRIYALPSLVAMRAAPGRAVPREEGVAVPSAIEGPILLDRDGTVWCASVAGGGLRRVRAVGGVSLVDDSVARMGPSARVDALSSSLVHTLYEDHEGNVWIGTSLGLDRFRAADIVTETSVPAGFRARFVTAMPDAIYAYTGWSGSAARANDGTQALYRIQPGRAPGQFVANVGRLRGMIRDDRRGTLWLITQSGLQPLLGRRLGPPMALPPGVEGKSVYSAAFDRAGELWMSAYAHGVYRRVAGQWQPVGLKSRVGATGVVIADPDGGMWVRYSGGSLFRVVNGRTQDFSNNDLHIGDVTFIRPDGRGLIFGGEKGIGMLVDGRFHALRADRIAALSGVTGIANTPDGSTWIFTQAGILRAATRSLERALMQGDPGALRYELFDAGDGLPGAPYGAVYGSSAAVDAAGRAWFTTGAGLVWIDPRNLSHNPRAPNVVIESVNVDGQAHPTAPALALAPGTNNIEIEYTALSLSNPDRVRFRYRLDGVDADWVDAGNRRQAFYTRLGPGHYVFRVIAANNDGVWNDRGTQIAVTIAPTFLQSRLFMVLCSLVGAALLWLAYSLRMRQLGARLRTQLEARLSERERIARELHDTLLQGFQGLMLLFQSAADRLDDDLPARHLLEHAMERGDAVLLEGRERVRDLRSAQVVDNIAQILRDIPDRAPCPDGVDYRVYERGAVRRFDAPAADEIVRICSEAVTNAFRHAQAHRVTVTITYGRTEMRMTIDDDGIGVSEQSLDAAIRKGRFGVLGMRERARKIMGQLTIQPIPARGTRVLLIVPARVAYAAQDDARRGIVCRITRTLRPGRTSDRLAQDV